MTELTIKASAEPSPCADTPLLTPFDLEDNLIKVRNALDVLTFIQDNAARAGGQYDAHVFGSALNALCEFFGELETDIMGDDPETVNPRASRSNGRWMPSAAG